MYDNRNLRNRNVGFIKRVTRCPVHTHVAVPIAGLKNSTKYLQRSLRNSLPFKSRWLLYVSPSLLFINTFWPHGTVMRLVRLPEKTGVISQYWD